MNEYLYKLIEKQRKTVNRIGGYFTLITRNDVTLKIIVMEVPCFYIVKNFGEFS